MARIKGYNNNKGIIEKVRQNINKINNRIKELKLGKERNIRRDFTKVDFFKLDKKQKQILIDLNNLRQQTIKHSEDETLSQATVVSLLNLIRVMDVKIKIYEEDWKKWKTKERERKNRLKNK